MTVPLHDLDAIQADLLAQMAEGPVYVESTNGSAWIDLWDGDGDMWLDFYPDEWSELSSDDFYLGETMTVLGFGREDSLDMYTKPGTPVGNLFDAIQTSMPIRFLKGA